ncbi:hypothetical protein I4F81_011328 [Pyropia yezoensis]|uniref:Uncharacterized protein n=1 Tax=Pyropia yezoensis TaxID=2788 RepID=A0ACC3CF00_PYRYE|nr:hypothetical protein I4F81_011328 [Neopyropia yezoensis]
MCSTERLRPLQCPAMRRAACCPKVTAPTARRPARSPRPPPPPPARPTPPFPLVPIACGLLSVMYARHAVKGGERYSEATHVSDAEMPPHNRKVPSPMAAAPNRESAPHRHPWQQQQQTSFAAAATNPTPTVY